MQNVENENVCRNGFHIAQSSCTCIAYGKNKTCSKILENEIPSFKF